MASPPYTFFASEKGSALAVAHDVVVVTLNYRLGAFGLLPMHDDAASGKSTGRVEAADLLDSFFTF